MTTRNRKLHWAFNHVEEAINQLEQAEALFAEAGGDAPNMWADYMARHAKMLANDVLSKHYMVKEVT